MIKPPYFSWWRPHFCWRNPQNVGVPQVPPSPKKNWASANVIPAAKPTTTWGPTVCDGEGTPAPSLAKSHGERKSGAHHFPSWDWDGRNTKFACKNITGWWSTYPSEKYESQLGWLFPIYGKNVPNHQLDKIMRTCLKLLISQYPKINRKPWGHFGSQDRNTTCLSNVKWLHHATNVSKSIKFLRLNSSNSGQSMVTQALQHGLVGYTIWRPYVCAH